MKYRYYICVAKTEFSLGVFYFNLREKFSAVLNALYFA